MNEKSFLLSRIIAFQSAALSRILDISSDIVEDLSPRS